MDIFDITNFSRQFFLKAADVGKEKALATEKVFTTFFILAEVSPGISLPLKRQQLSCSLLHVPMPQCRVSLPPPLHVSGM